MPKIGDYIKLLREGCRKIRGAKILEEIRYQVAWGVSLFAHTHGLQFAKNNDMQKNLSTFTARFCLNTQYAKSCQSFRETTVHMCVIHTCK